MSPLFDWFIDSLASEDIIDLYFILSDLVDINLTEAEYLEIAQYDSLASSATREQRNRYHIPLGKLVL